MRYVLARVCSFSTDRYNYTEYIVCVYTKIVASVWSIKQKNTQYYAVGRNSDGRAQATHTYGARPMESRKLMTAAARITEVASANTMAEDMAARWCARYVLGDVLDVP